MKKFKGWLALTLTVTLLGSNAIYSMGSALQANELATETSSVPEEQVTPVNESDLHIDVVEDPQQQSVVEQPITEQPIIEQPVEDAVEQEVLPQEVNENVYTYELQNVTEEKVLSILYREEPKLEEPKLEETKKENKNEQVEKEGGRATKNVDGRYSLTLPAPSDMGITRDAFKRCNIVCILLFESRA